MYITLDGPSGSGKSTQLEILAHKFKLLKAPFWRACVAFDSIAKLVATPTPYTNIMATIAASHTIPISQKCILDHFWCCLRSVGNDDPSALSQTITFFRDGLRFGGRPEPALSIYLDLPHELWIKRSFKRDLGAITSFNVDNEKQLHDIKIRDFWACIEKQVSYFHVVDGTGSIDEVTKSIIQLLPKQYRNLS